MSNWEKWLDYLATTTDLQGRSYLEAVYEDGTVRRCCLGVGCRLAGIAASERQWQTPITFDDVTNNVAPVAFEEMTGLPPKSFIDWLGLPYEDDEAVYSPWDIGVDGAPVTRDEEVLTAATMNDKGFTFAQIAQTFRYFGGVAITR